MTFPEVLATLRKMAQAWRYEEDRAFGQGNAILARDCRLRASALEFAIEKLEQDEADSKKGNT